MDGPLGLLFPVLNSFSIRFKFVSNSFICFKFVLNSFLFNRGHILDFFQIFKYFFSNYRITKKRWESKKFLCDDCGFTCASKATLNTHKMFKHGDLPPKSLTCDTCG